MQVKLFEKISVSYSSDAKSSYLMLQVARDEKLYKHQIATLSNTQVHSILQFKVVTKDDIVSFYYDITSRQTLAQILKRKKFSKIEIVDVLLKICRVITECNNYYLNEDNFLLSEDYIYLNPSTLEVALICVPISLPKKHTDADFYRLVNKLIANIDVTESKSNEFVQKTLGEINTEPFNYLKFSQYLANTIVGDKGKSDLAPANKSVYVEPAEAIQQQGDIQRPIKLEVEFNQDYVEQRRSIPKQQNKNRIDLSVTKNNKKGKRIALIVLVQILILIGLALIVIETDLIIDETRAFDPIAMAGLIMLAGIADYFIIKKLIYGKELKNEAVNVKLKTPNYNKPKFDFVRQKPINQSERKAESVNKPMSVDMVDDHARSISGKSYAKHPHSSKLATELLDSADDVKKEGYLSYEAYGKKEKRKIDNNPFIIGKLVDQADFIIDSKAVSRVHAEIYLEKGVYYVVDLNSKNGTYLNGKRIQSNIKYQLNNNDVLCFAREEYTFIQ